jgi:WD40 repeat protein
MMGAGVDRAVYIWNTGTWQLEHRLEGQPEMISALTLSPGLCTGITLPSAGLARLVTPRV